MTITATKMMKMKTKTMIIQITTAEAVAEAGGQIMQRWQQRHYQVHIRINQQNNFFGGRIGRQIERLRQIYTSYDMYDDDDRIIVPIQIEQQDGFAISAVALRLSAARYICHDMCNVTAAPAAPL